MQPRAGSALADEVADLQASIRLFLSDVAPLGLQHPFGFAKLFLLHVMSQTEQSEQ
jgi:hypothetical protein